jgi:branched-chain amino acid transport system permease protein
VVFVPVLLVLLSVPRWGSRGMISMLVEFFFYLGVSQMWNLLAGYGGVVSVGQHAYIGLGGYMLFLFTVVFGLHPLLSIVVAGIICAVVSIPVAGLVFRLQGAYLAIGTWVIAEVFELVFYRIFTLGGGTGMSLPVSVAQRVNIPPLGRDGVLYLVALILCALVNFGAYAMLCSRGGLAMKAVRDNEGAARSSGIDNVRLKLIIYVVAALGTGLLGALIYLNEFFISPTSAFDINWTCYMIFIVVIGGIGTLEGPIVGTIVFFVLRQYLSDLGSWYLIILGALAIVIMLKMPEGIWGAIGMRFDIHVFPTRRRLVFGKGEGVDS